MTKQTTPYYRGARAALWFGPYLSVIFFSIVVQFPLLQLAGTLLILALPVTTAIALRRSFTGSGYRRSYAELWVEGISMYLFGCAICALVTMVYLKWCDPGALMRMTMQTIETLRQVGTPEYNELARVLNNAVKESLVIVPSQFVISMFWSTMVLGCFLSMISAAIARIGRRPATNQPLRYPGEDESFSA